ncbi:hypothetical protein [Xenorhabdus griffiniae]|uniref:hypothetical protein n=1 Tax=Xenorhabdus griffiniae TaxID=351672 RepID=UPI003B585BD7
MAQIADKAVVSREALYRTRPPKGQKLCAISVFSYCGNDLIWPDTIYQNEG